MKGKEIVEFLKTQVIIDESVKKDMNNLILMDKYKEKARRAYHETN